MSTFVDKKVVRFFATCPRGLEKVLFDELVSLGAENPQLQASGVHFQGDLRLGMKVNLYSRFASRILQRVGHGPYQSEEDVYQLVKNVPWERWWNENHRFRLDVSARNSPVKSLNFITLKAKDAVCDRFRSLTGNRPSVDKTTPDVRAVVFLDDHFCSIYLDWSGESLFKRGWRQATGEAPIKENLAAALVALSGWKADQVLLDPMCGSGTILIEAALMAQGIAPGLRRHFAFESFNQIEKHFWLDLRYEAKQQASQASIPLKICGSDISEEMIEIAKQNANSAGVKIYWKCSDARHIPPPADEGVLITNPPYDERVGVEGDQAEAFFIDWASHLKHEFAGWSCWIISSEPSLIQQMHLRSNQKISLFNGDLACTFFNFVMRKGKFISKY